MIDEPLSGAEQNKVIIFLFLLTISALLAVGILPAILLGIGFHMMKKNNDFSLLQGAIFNFKLLLTLGIACLIITAGYSYYDGTTGYTRSGYNWYHDETLLISLAFIPAIVFFLILVVFLLEKPLTLHRNWVAARGPFAVQETPNSFEQTRSEPRANADTKEPVEDSIADELAKWVKLKNEGDISELEYKEAREKLLAKV